MNKAGKIGIVCSGGDAPGINNLIYGIFENLDNKFDLIGYMDGFGGIFRNNYLKIDIKNVDSIQLEGSSIIGCERFPEFEDTKIQTKIIENLKNNRISHLIILGGNGSLIASRILASRGINVHFVPTTVDNDVSEVSKTLGFNTAQNSVIDFIRKVNYSAKNHKKVQIFELMGRACSDLTNTVGNSVYADFIVNNSNYKDLNLIERIAEKINNSEKRTNIIVISEKLLDTRILVDQLSQKIAKRIWFSVIGHFQRGGTPSFDDCYYGYVCSKNIIKNILENIANLIYSVDEEVAL